MDGLKSRNGGNNRYAYIMTIKAFSYNQNKINEGAVIYE
jgi:hypothetical protein